MLALIFSQDKGKILKPIVWVLGQIMNAIFNALNAIGIPNVGLAIIIFTIVVNLCLLPLTYKQQKFSKLQSKMSPELKAIQEKYKGKKDNDSMLAMQQETKEVYAKYGVSQTGSCLQLLIQMPILISLYRVIYAIPGYVKIVKDAFYPLVEQIRTTDGAIDFVQNSISSANSFQGQFSNELFTSGNTQYVENTIIDVLNRASSADWNSFSEKFSGLSTSIQNTHALLSKYNSFLGLNISDSPGFMVKTAFANKQFALLIGAIMIPLLSAFTQWVSVKLMPQPTQADGKADPNDTAAQMQQSMKTMNVMMPIMSAVFCFSLPAGMGIYWIASAVVRAIQQVFINRHIDKSDIDAQIAKNIEKYNEKKEKMKTTPSMNRYANMNTRRISSDVVKSSVSMAEREAELEKVRSQFSGKEIRQDSLLAKANMVKEFNEKNNK